MDFTMGASSFMVLTMDSHPRPIKSTQEDDLTQLEGDFQDSNPLESIKGMFSTFLTKET
jgi:hypothetical protein